MPRRIGGSTNANPHPYLWGIRPSIRTDHPYPCYCLNVTRFDGDARREGRKRRPDIDGSTTMWKALLFGLDIHELVVLDADDGDSVEGGAVLVQIRRCLD